MLCYCRFARYSLSDVYSVAKLHNDLLLKSVYRLTNVVCTGQNTYALITLKIMYQCSFAKNVTVGLQL